MKEWLCIIGLLCSLTNLAQDVTLRPQVQESSKKDIVHEKIVWRLVDFNQRANQYMYYPISPSGEYRSLITYLLEMVQHKVALAYEHEPDVYHENPHTVNTFEWKLKNDPPDVLIEDPVTGEIIPPVDEGLQLQSIKRLLIKEIWFFDKNRSQLGSRIIAICPIREYFREEDLDEETPLYKKTAWFDFAKIEPLLAQCPVKLSPDSPRSLTYADVFRQHLYDGVIVQESNMFDRAINEYKEYDQILLEGRQIQEKMRDEESDSWDN